MIRLRLTEAEVAKAQQMWAKGVPLGLIATVLDCSVYALSPWIYSDIIPAALRDKGRDDD